MTLRSRLPILLSECIARGIEVSFIYHMKEPLIDWRSRKTSGHSHLDLFIPGVYGGNDIEICNILEEIIEEYDK